MKQIMFIFLIIGICLSSCTRKSISSNDEIKQIIIEKYKNVRSSLKGGNPNYVINMHTQDAVQFLQNGKELVGIVELRAFYERIATMGIDIKSVPTTIELLTNDVAFEVGTFTSTSKTGMLNSAKYIIIWKKINNEWKIYKAIDQAKL